MKPPKTPPRPPCPDMARLVAASFCDRRVRHGSVAGRSRIDADLLSRLESRA